MREKAVALIQEPTSFDQIAEELIVGKLETKDQLKNLQNEIAQELGRHL